MSKGEGEKLFEKSFSPSPFAPLPLFKKFWKYGGFGLGLIFGLRFLAAVFFYRITLASR